VSRGLLVRSGAGSEWVEEPAPRRRCRRPPGDRAVLGDAGRAGRRAGAALAAAPARLLPIGHASRRSEPAPGTGWSSSTGYRPPWCVCAMESPRTCWPAGFGCPARRSPRRSARCANRQGDRGCPAGGECGCPPRPTGSPTWAGSGQLGLLDAPGSRCANRRSARPRDSGPSPARPAPRPPRTLVLTDPAGRLLFCAPTYPGAIHQLPQVCLAGRVQLAASRASPCRLTPMIRAPACRSPVQARKGSLSRRRADQLRRPPVVVRIRRRLVDLVRCERAAVPAPAEALCGPVRRLGLVSRRDALLHQEELPAARTGVVS
jgi:hypothetical protein